MKGVINVNNTERFSGKGEIYAKARPKYSEKLFEYLKENYGLTEDSIVADIGSGTGIFTQSLLEIGCRVFAVEPNEDMRKRAEEKLCSYENFISSDGTADRTSLADNIADFVIAAQAFHWFDADKFKAECKRILKKDAVVIIAYNSRDNEAECTKALYELRKKFNPDFHGFSNGINDEKCRSFFENSCDVFKVDNSQIYDRDGYKNRVLSSSYSLKEGDEKYEEYLAEINEIFNKFSSDEKMTVPTYTVAYIGKI